MHSVEICMPFSVVHRSEERNKKQEKQARRCACNLTHYVCSTGSLSRTTLSMLIAWKRNCLAGLQR